MGHLGLAYSSVTFSEKCMVQLRCGVYMLIRHHIQRGNSVRVECYGSLLRGKKNVQNYFSIFWGSFFAADL